MKLKILMMMALLLAFSAQVKADITAENAWIRLLPPVAKSTAAYVDISSSQPDSLLSVSSEFAMMTELHQTTMEDGVMSMSHVESITLPENSKVSLTPGGYHIMLMNLKAPLSAGQRYPITLRFKQAGEVPIEFEVR